MLVHTHTRTTPQFQEEARLLIEESGLFRVKKFLSENHTRFTYTCAHHPEDVLEGSLFWIVRRKTCCPERKVWCTCSGCGCMWVWGLPPLRMRSPCSIHPMRVHMGCIGPLLVYADRPFKREPPQFCSTDKSSSPDRTYMGLF